MNREYLLGVDIGTTALKAILFTKEGEIVKSVVKEYKLETPKPHWVECNPQVYWESFKSCISEITQDISPSNIETLGISSQGESFIPLDKEGKPLRKAIVWLDDRAEKEAKAIKEIFSQEETYFITGQPDILPAWPACKILWLRKNEHNLFKKVYKYLFLEDYLIFKLTGRAVSDYSLFCSSLMLNIKRKKWWEEMLKFIGISPGQLPRLAESGTVVGNIVNKETGLSEQTVVVTGGMDQVCGMVGVGNIIPGIISETTGGALAICATTGKPIFDPSCRIPCHYHACKDTYFLLPWCQTGGMSLRWLRDEFEYSNYEEMTKEAVQISAGSEGLIFLPHLAGAGSPEFNPKARGVFFGIALNTKKAHFIRATMESIGYLIRQNMDVLEELGIKIKEIHSLGGGSRSSLWNQIKADIIGRPIITMRTEEAACLGAAILAGFGKGIFPSLEDACKIMNRKKDEYLPDKRNVPIYQKAYNKYLKISKTLLPLF